jgi:hypothetical protein
MTNVLKAMYKKTWLATLGTFEEFVGYCLCFTDRDHLILLLKNKQLKHTMTIGEIMCVLNDIKFDQVTKKQLFQKFYSQSHNSSFLTPLENTKNVLSIPHDLVNLKIDEVRNFLAKK